MSPRTKLGPGFVVALALLGGLASAGLVLGLFMLLLAGAGSGPAGGCGLSPAASAISLDAPGTGALAGATEYGGPGDARSGILGARGDNLLSHPDSYAELGGLTWQTADAMGGLPYLTPLRITWGRHSVVAVKRDFGLGGGPIEGHPRVIDLWWQLAGRLGIPYQHGLWSGTVRVQRLPAAGAATMLDVASVAPQVAGPGELAGGTLGGSCQDDGALLLTPGTTARLLADGHAAAPADAPAPVQAMIAAGNAIAGRPYLFGGGHDVPLSELSPVYDCSSSVEHLLYGAGLLPADFLAASSALERTGAPGPGRWVTIYASADHVFMYVAGLRWDTHNAAGVGDGSGGIGWHPLVRSSSGFVARHPVGL